MRSVIDDHIQLDSTNGEHVNITVSLVGNSLGGLYSRYAIAKLSEKSDVDEEFLLLGGRIKAHFNVFCTTGELLEFGSERNKVSCQSFDKSVSAPTSSCHQKQLHIWVSQDIHTFQFRDQLKLGLEK